VPIFACNSIKVKKGRNLFSSFRREQGVFQDLEAGCVALGVGYARSETVDRVLGWDAAGVATTAMRLGITAGKFLKFHVQNSAFRRTFGSRHVDLIVALAHHLFGGTRL
jgi:hypothetical protein